jgi:hypothetical protein
VCPTVATIRPVCSGFAKLQHQNWIDTLCCSVGVRVSTEFVIDRLAQPQCCTQAGRQAHAVGLTSQNSDPVVC